MSDPYRELMKISPHWFGPNDEYVDLSRVVGAWFVDNRQKYRVFLPSQTGVVNGDPVFTLTIGPVDVAESLASALRMYKENLPCG